MRKAILTGAILVSAIGVVLGTGVAAVAAPSYPLNVCIPQGGTGKATQCINNWDGNLALDATAVAFYHYGNSRGYNEIDVLVVGTITRPGTFQPFANGSNLNATYNGDQVLEFQWWRAGRDSGVCIGGAGYNEDAYNESCNKPAQDELWFVWTKYSGLVSVAGSNARFYVTGTPNQPVWLGAAGNAKIANGDNVYLTTIQSNNLPFHLYGDGG